MNRAFDESTEVEPVSVPSYGVRSSIPEINGDPLDKIFDRFKNYIDDKFGEFKESIPLQANCPDTESKKFKREVEAKKLKFKGNEKQLLFNAEIEDHNSIALDSIKKGERAEAQKSLETSLELIRKRQKLIKLADKSEAGWLVVQEYEQEELADNSDDEKRIKKAQEKASRKKKQMATSTKKARLDTSSSTATFSRNEDKQLFREYLI